MGSPYITSRTQPDSVPMLFGSERVQLAFMTAGGENRKEDSLALKVASMLERLERRAEGQPILNEIR